VKAIAPSVQDLFKRHGVTVEEYLEVLRELFFVAELVTLSGPTPPNRDEDDRKFLQCAAEGDADFLITFDSDLLDVGQSGKTRIIRPGDFVRVARTEQIGLAEAFRSN
jgi:predicted nucleic acid-binding protein